MMGGLYALGALGAVIGMGGDGLCLLAGMAYLAGLRSVAAALVMLGAMVWALSGLVWFAMIVQTEGSFARPAMAWAVSGAACSLALTVIKGERQSPGEWICFFVMVGANVVRAVISR